MQALQCAVGKGFGLVDQVLGGAGHVVFIACQRLARACGSGGCTAQQIADLGEGVFEAEVVMHGDRKSVV